MSTPTMQATERAFKRGRPLPEVTDLVGKGRTAACCARRRLGQASDLLTAQDMEDLIQAATFSSTARWVKNASTSAAPISAGWRTLWK